MKKFRFFRKGVALVCIALVCLLNHLALNAQAEEFSHTVSTGQPVPGVEIPGGATGTVELQAIPPTIVIVSAVIIAGLVSLACAICPNSATSVSQVVSNGSVNQIDYKTSLLASLD